MADSRGQWKKCQSRSKPGRYYYVNKVTKEKSWKLPEGVTFHVPSESGAKAGPAIGATPGGNSAELNFSGLGAGGEGDADVSSVSFSELGMCSADTSTVSEGGGVGGEGGADVSSVSFSELGMCSADTGTVSEGGGVGGEGGGVGGEGGGVSSEGGGVGSEGAGVGGGVGGEGAGVGSEGGGVGGEGAGVGSEGDVVHEAMPSLEDAGAVQNPVVKNSDRKRPVKLLPADTMENLKDAGNVDQTSNSSQAGGTEIMLDDGLTSEEQLDIMEVVDAVSSELAPSMTDICPVPLMKPARQHKDQVYLVLDTSSMLTHLQVLREFKTAPIRTLKVQAVLVVPLSVVRKLSNLLKLSDEMVRKRVQLATEFLCGSVSSSHPGVVVQSLEEASQVPSPGTVACSDPVIRCCHDYQKVAVHRGTVMLFTDDIQLSTVAMVNGVRTGNRKTLLPQLAILCKAQQRRGSWSGSESVCHSQPGHDLCVCECEATVGTVLSAVIRKEMILGYDSLWSAVVAIKPPWNLQNIFAIIDKHWLAVFGMILDRSLKHTCVVPLVDYANTRTHTGRTPGLAQLSQFVKKSKMLLSGFTSPSKDKYEDMVNYAISYLTGLSLHLSNKQAFSPNLVYPMKRMSLGHATIVGRGSGADVSPSLTPTSLPTFSASKFTYPAAAIADHSLLAPALTIATPPTNTKSSTHLPTSTLGSSPDLNPNFTPNFTPVPISLTASATEQMSSQHIRTSTSSPGSGQLPPSPNLLDSGKDPVTSGMQSCQLGFAARRGRGRSRTNVGLGFGGKRRPIWERGTTPASNSRLGQGRGLLVGMHLADLSGGGNIITGPDLLESGSVLTNAHLSTFLVNAGRRSGMVESLQEFLSRMPTSSSQQLEWVLGVVQRTAQLAVFVSKSGALEEEQGAEFILTLVSNLEEFISTMKVVVDKDPSITSVRNFLASMELLLQNLDLRCPLNFSLLCEILPAHHTEQQGARLLAYLSVLEEHCSALKQY